MSGTQTMASDVHYDPHSVEIAYDPWALFKRMRDEAPLYYNAEHDFFALSRFEDVERIHVDRQTFSSTKGATLDMVKLARAGLFDIPPGTVIFEDAPSHTIHRALLSRMFTPRRVTELEPMIRQVTREMIDPCVETGRFDFVVDLGNVMPSLVIGMLIGIPEKDRLAIRDHYGKSQGEKETADINNLSGEIFADYIDWRVEHPSDDIMTQLLNAEVDDPEGGKRPLTREELLAYVNIVAAAGNDTTRRLIGWMGKVLSDHPDQRQLLVDNPELIPGAVDEILRFEPPALHSGRFTLRDIELHGETVPAGSIMLPMLGAANRDERKIEDPDRFDVTRKPGTMFTFGFGAHYCLGQALARLEGRVALEEVLARFPTWEADADNAVFAFNGDLRGWDAYPVVAV
jgi:cytochrome P450